MKGSATGAVGNLLVDNRGIDTGNQLTPLPGIDQGTVLAVAANNLKSTVAVWQPGALKGLKFNPNTAQDKLFTIIDNTADTLYIDPAEGDLTLVATAGNTFTGVLAVDSVTITGLARIQSVGRLVVSNELVVDGASLYGTNNDITADKVTLKNSGLLSHLGATTSSTYKLALNAFTSLTIDSTSKIDVSSKGYLGGVQGSNNNSGYGRTVGNTITGGSYDSSGGSYGGLGGIWNAKQVNAVYGDPADPNDLGSGGGSSYYASPGGNGGGLIRLKVGSLVLSGSILSPIALPCSSWMR